MNRYRDDPRWVPLSEWFDRNVGGDPRVSGPTYNMAENLTIGVLDILDALDAAADEGVPS